MSDLLERLRFGGNHKSELTRHEAADRIEQLEAALRAIRDDGKNCVDHCRRQADRALSRAALDQSSPPARQENDDVYPGFRGNNEA